MAKVDRSTWDANRAMSACTTAGDYEAICAGRRSGDGSLRQTWALPHHYLGHTEPNATAVAQALGRFDQTQGLTNREAARAHLERHRATIQADTTASAESSAEPVGYPRDNLVRAVSPARGILEVREATPGSDAMPTLVGHFARTGEWTKIDSVFEGTFMEQIAPGAFDRTFAEDRDAMRVTFNHGKDPSLGDKVLGPIDELREDDDGGYYEVPLFDTQYNRELLPGLRAGAYGASFRFIVQSENVEKKPERSDWNPDGIPQRTITGARVLEFGPVTFPAYAGATAGVRSMTDEFVFGRLTGGEGLKKFADYVAAQDQLVARVDQASVTTSSASANLPPDRALGTGNTPTTVPTEPGDPNDTTTCPDCGRDVASDASTCPYCGADMNRAAAAEGSPSSAPTTEEGGKQMNIDELRSIDDLESRRAEIVTELNAMNQAAGVRNLDATERETWEDLKDEHTAISARIDEKNERDKLLRSIDPEDPRRAESERTTKVTRDFSVQVRPSVEDIYNLPGYRDRARNQAEEVALRRDGAMRSVEGATFPLGNQEDVQTHIQRLLDRMDDDSDVNPMRDELSKRILVTGSPIYRRAYGKWLKNQGQMGALSPEEQRALSLGTGATGGFGIVYTLDPTVVPTSNYSVNPYRAIARNEQIAGTNEWKAVTSGAITASYTQEATEAGDNAPTLAQPDIIVEKAQAFVPFSIEVGQDWGQLQGEMAQLFSDAKDDLEATKFTLGAGHGSFEPKGLITAATATTTAGGAAAFAIADLYKLFEALPPRFRPRAKFLANLFTADKIRQFDTAGGSGVWQGQSFNGQAGLAPGVGGNYAGTADANFGPMVLGRPFYESTAMVSALTTGSKILVVGDFRYFVIVDRVGMDTEFLPLMVGTNHRPTGQRGLYAYWRNSSDVLSAAAFQVLVTG